MLAAVTVFMFPVLKARFLLYIGIMRHKLNDVKACYTYMHSGNCHFKPGIIKGASVTGLSNSYSQVLHIIVSMESKVNLYEALVQVKLTSDAFIASQPGFPSPVEQSEISENHSSQFIQLL